MDVAYVYDHIQEDPPAGQQKKEGESSEGEASLNKDLQEAYKSFSASPWGSRIGGFFGNVVKQVGITFGLHFPGGLLPSINLVLIAPRRASRSTRRPPRSLPKSVRMRPRASAACASRW